MTEKINTILTGATGVTLVQLATALPSPEEISQIGNLLIQMAIGAVTLYRLLKNRNNNNDGNNPPPPPPELVG
jgi:hypothetical protein